MSLDELEKYIQFLLDNIQNKLKNSNKNNFNKRFSVQNPIKKRKVTQRTSEVLKKYGLTSLFEKKPMTDKSSSN